jgi:hypothetical protein
VCPNALLTGASSASHAHDACMHIYAKQRATMSSTCSTPFSPILFRPEEKTPALYHRMTTGLLPGLLLRLVDRALMICTPQPATALTQPPPYPRSNSLEFARSLRAYISYQAHMDLHTTICACFRSRTEHNESIFSQSPTISRFLQQLRTPSPHLVDNIHLAKNP